MSNVKDTKLDGDVIIGRNLTTGGEIVANGNSIFKKGLKVEGWLDAKNLRGPCKGLFATEEALEDKYPNPERGWFALVGTTVPAKVYRVEKQGRESSWINTGETSSLLDVEIHQLTELHEADDALEAKITELSDAIHEEKVTRQAFDNAIVKSLDEEKSNRIASDTELEEAINAVDMYVRVVVPDLTLPSWGVEEKSTIANTIVDAIFDANKTKKGVLLIDTYHVIPISMYATDEVDLWLTYAIPNGNDEAILYCKSIEKGGYIYDDDKYSLGITSLEFYDVINLDQSSIKQSYYQGENDLIVYNSTTKTFIAMVVESGVLPQYHGNSLKLKKFGKDGAFGCTPMKNVLYHTSNAVYIWDGTNLNQILNRQGDTSVPIDAYTKAEVDALLARQDETINALIAQIQSGNTTEGIDSLEEIKSFLSGMSDTDTLAEKLKDAGAMDEATVQQIASDIVEEAIKDIDGEITPTYDAESGKLTLS